MKARISSVYESLNKNERINAIKAVSEAMMNKNTENSDNLKIDLSPLKLQPSDHEKFVESLPRFRKIGI